MMSTTFIFLFSLMVFSYNGYADSVMSSDENRSDVEKQDSVSQQEESSLNEYAFEGMETFNIDERPDGHAPIGIMGDHVHDQGEFMLSFRLMMMREKIKVEKVGDNKEFITVDKDVNIDMWMGMLGLMYGLTDRWTAMTMVPYLLYDISDVDHALGDISLSVLYAPLKEDFYRMVLSLEVFFPTAGLDYISGVMEEEWEGKGIQYIVMIPWSAYAFLPKLSTLFYWDQLSLGFQIGFKYSFDFVGEGSLRRFENKLEPTAHIWGTCSLSKNFSVSLRGVYQGDNKHKHSVLTYLGLNYIGTDFLEGHRLAFEVGLPVYRSSSVKTQSYMFQLGWQKAF